MSVALNYQLSVFGKFTIAPLPDVITALMNKINTETQEIFLPNIINSQQIEIPSNKICYFLIFTMDYLGYHI